MSQTTTMPVALTNWRPMQRNSLRGFASVRLGKSLIIEDCPVHTSNGKRWASLPSKPILDKDGTAQKDAAGKIKYAPLLKWADRDASDRFSEAVIAAVERENPGATNAD